MLQQGPRWRETFYFISILVTIGLTQLIGRSVCVRTPLLSPENRITRKCAISHQKRHNHAATYASMTYTGMPKAGDWM